ncbi:MAG: amidohydrolase family protein [Steroidobacteraceae bacterium]
MADQSDESGAGITDQARDQGSADGTQAPRGMARRNFLAAGAAGVLAAVTRSTTSAVAGESAPGPAARAGATCENEGAPDIILTNGKIHTMDARNSIVSEVAIKNRRFLSVGRAPRKASCTRVVDLRGATVVPGMIEGHVHMVSLASRPGYHVVIENARNIAEVQETLAQRRKDVPDGQFITAMGGWTPNFFAEKRLPTLKELDAAVPDRPVFLYGGGIGRTNTLGKAWFEKQAMPVTIDAEGTAAGGQAAQHNLALYHLRVAQTFEDKRRSALDAMAYCARVGLTANLDQVFPPSAGPLTPRQGLAGLDNFRVYDPWLSLHREKKAFIRLQMNFLHDQNDINLPELKERLKNQFQLFGDDMLMTGGIGEWGAPGDGVGPVWYEAQRLIAQARWRNTNRCLTLDTLEAIVAGYERVNKEFDITGLRWSVHHLSFATPGHLNRLKAMNIGVQSGAWRFVSGTPGNAGAPFRMIQDSGIQNGIHLDGVHVAPLNPWMGVYYAATGVNVMGALVNDGQQITRQEAVKLYTRANAWHMNMEDRIGSIEPGKLADLAVLNRDYMTCTDEELKRIMSVMTICDGKIVHEAGPIGARRA